uniref:Uncharacterized protein n=1 Tax=Lutzomyia longipalpis TaxID=7200 RepID=A0A7G3B771_LUTLO
MASKNQRSGKIAKIVAVAVTVLILVETFGLADSQDWDWYDWYYRSGGNRRTTNQRQGQTASSFTLINASPIFVVPFFSNVRGNNANTGIQQGQRQGGG